MSLSGERHSPNNIWFPRRAGWEKPKDRLVWTWTWAWLGRPLGSNLVACLNSNAADLSYSYWTYYAAVAQQQYCKIVLVCLRTIVCRLQSILWVRSPRERVVWNLVDRGAGQQLWNIFSKPQIYQCQSILEVSVYQQLRARSILCTYDSKNYCVCNPHNWKGVVHARSPNQCS